MKPLLIAYDGSADAKTALQYAAGVFPGRQAVVLTVWEPLILELTAAGSFSGAIVPDEEEGDVQAAAAARRIAEEGAALAVKLGLTATARSQSEVNAIGQEIADAAEALDAELIVTGSRGLTGLRSLLVGSVSAHVLRHALRPVLAVPSEHLIKARREDTKD